MGCFSPPLPPRLPVPQGHCQTARLPRPGTDATGSTPVTAATGMPLARGLWASWTFGLEGPLPSCPQPLFLHQQMVSPLVLWCPWPVGPALRASHVVETQSRAEQSVLQTPDKGPSFPAGRAFAHSRPSGVKTPGWAGRCWKRPSDGLGKPSLQGGTSSPRRNCTGSDPGSRGRGAWPRGCPWLARSLQGVGAEAPRGASGQRDGPSGSLVGLQERLRHLGGRWAAQAFPPS